MKEKILYVCDICGTEYLTKEEAQKCEENHVETLEIVDCEFVRKAFMNDGFPTKITVKSEDGTERTYFRCATI